MNKLVVFSNSGLANEYPLERPELVIGRDPDCHIRLDNPQVSRRHARLLIEADRVVVSDLGSRNGTFVAGRRIEDPTPLHDELVAIGHHKLFLARADGTATQSVEVRSEPVADRPLELPETQEIHGLTNAWPPEPPATREEQASDGGGAAA
jgi:pSer/pThr/pTyr-binding forkhead associated (FHA) protein